MWSVLWLLGSAVLEQNSPQAMLNPTGELCSLKCHKETPKFEFHIIFTCRDTSFFFKFFFLQ